MMVTKTLPVEVSEDVQRPAIRNRQIGVRLTESEYTVLEKMAWKASRTIGDWAREQLLTSMGLTADENSAGQLLTEIVGLQLFLTNVLAPIACGEKMSVEQYRELMQQVKTNKHQATHEVIAQYAKEKKEQSDD
jgi:hypothetical protein